MRGGPRLLMSPYFTGSLGAMLIIVSFSYWSVSTHNKFLTNKLSEIQEQLKIQVNTLEDLEVRSAKYQLVLKQERDKLENERDDCLKKFDLLEKENIHQVGKIHELEELKDNLNKENEDLKDVEEEVRLRDENNKLQENLDIAQSKLSTLENKLEEEEIKSRDLQGKLSELLETDPHAAARMPPSQFFGRQAQLGQGQLPDVNPASVSVIKKDTLGMKFHTDKNGRYLPIIVQGNPRLPRPTPRYSVVNPMHDRIKHSVDGSGGGGNVLKILPPASPKPASPGLKLLPEIMNPADQNFGPSPPVPGRGISSTSPVPKNNKQIPLPQNILQHNEDLKKDENVSVIDEHGEGDIHNNIENSGSVVDGENVEKIMEAQLENTADKSAEHKDEQKNVDNDEADLTNPEQEENDDQDAGGMLENKNDSVIDFPDDTNNQDAETINQIESKAETVNHEYNFNDLGDK